MSRLAIYLIVVLVLVLLFLCFVSVVPHAWTLFVS